MEGTCDLSEIFRQMAKSAELLGTSIYEIQASWTGPDELRQANYAQRSLPKGLKFLCMVPRSEFPKVMGLMGIHDQDALHCFNGMTHCPWCGKEGQNEGTVVNHLQMVHYMLGLVCNKCNDFPSTSLDTLCCHGWQDCQQPGEKVPNELVLSRVLTSRRQAKSIHLSQESKQRSPGGMVFLGCPIRDIPAHWHSPGGGPMEKASPANPHILSPVFPHNLTRLLPTTPKLHKTCLRFEVDNNEIIKG